jgi:hypothetical protein
MREARFLAEQRLLIIYVEAYPGIVERRFSAVENLIGELAQAAVIRLRDENPELDLTVGR